MEPDTILDGAKKAFFEAMLAGYANDGSTPTTNLVKTKTPDGDTILEYTTGDYKVVDRYCVTPRSSKSAGTTTVYFTGDPVWWMAYAGYYEKQAIVFLKKVLRSAYSQGQFYGGRGINVWSEGVGSRFAYYNISNKQQFDEFAGHERMTDLETGRVVGFHDYFGRSLI